MEILSPSSKLEHKSYLAITTSKFYLKVAGEKRLLEFNELDELRLDVYENAKIYKE